MKFEDQNNKEGKKRRVSNIVSLFLKGLRPIYWSKPTIRDLFSSEDSYSKSTLLNIVLSDFIPNLFHPFYVSFPAMNKTLRRNKPNYLYVAPHNLLLDYVKPESFCWRTSCQPTVQYSGGSPSLILLSLSTWQRYVCGISQSLLPTLKWEMCPTLIGRSQFVRDKTTLFEDSDKYQEGKKFFAVDLLEHTIIRTWREGI